MEPIRAKAAAMTVAPVAAMDAKARFPAAEALGVPAHVRCETVLIRVTVADRSGAAIRCVTAADHTFAEIRCVMAADRIGEEIPSAMDDLLLGSRRGLALNVANQQTRLTNLLKENCARFQASCVMAERFFRLCGIRFRAADDQNE